MEKAQTKIRRTVKKNKKKQGKSSVILAGLFSFW
jgi:hypothetical protein